MQNTTNYNLKKPEGTDFYNIENENDNMDIIDAELKEHDDAISELNTKSMTSRSIVQDQTILSTLLALYHNSPIAGYFLAIRASDAPVSSGAWFVRYSVPEGSNNAYVEAVDLLGDQSVYVERIDLSNSTAFGWKRQMSQSDVLIEFQTESSHTVNANSANSLTVTHTKQGYNCYFMQYIDYRTSATWFVHVKEVSANNATIDIVNTSGTTYTAPTAKTMWLCIKA